MTNKENFEIGDKVKVIVDGNVTFKGELLGISSNTPIIDFWIVLIEDRLTEFMINRPEKALIVFHTYLEKIED